MLTACGTKADLSMGPAAHLVRSTIPFYDYGATQLFNQGISAVHHLHRSFFQEIGALLGPNVPVTWFHLEVSK